MRGVFQLELVVLLQHIVVNMRRVRVEVDRLAVHSRRVAVVELCDSADDVSDAVPACPDAVDEQGVDELMCLRIDGLHADVALGRGCHFDGWLSFSACGGPYDRSCDGGW